MMQIKSYKSKQILKNLLFGMRLELGSGRDSYALRDKKYKKTY